MIYADLHFTVFYCILLYFIVFFKDFLKFTWKRESVWGGGAEKPKQILH